MFMGFSSCTGPKEWMELVAEMLGRGGVHVECPHLVRTMDQLLL